MISDGLAFFFEFAGIVLVTTLFVATALWARPLWLARHRIKPRPAKSKGH